MKVLWNLVKLNAVFVMLGHLVSFKYGYSDWQLYVYVIGAALLTQMREATLFEEY